MNAEQLSIWRKAVNENVSSVEKLVDDRIALKQLFEEHLRIFFDYDDIEYDKDFHRIALKWENGRSPIIDNEIISQLGMDWCVSHKFDEALGDGVVIELYPFGMGD